MADVSAFAGSWTTGGSQRGKPGRFRQIARFWGSEEKIPAVLDFHDFLQQKG
ncbi:MAG: hypothetical protein HFF17_08985 [Oscillospiraceae bacterium]|nr:hypothetical protein [Oscillospiraceae bacterium]